MIILQTGPDGSRRAAAAAAECRGPVFKSDPGLSLEDTVSRIAGWMAQNNESGTDKVFYTTGRLTSEMVIKTVMMGIPILVSRSGFTAWGVDLARRAGLTLIGRARGARFIVLAGEQRVEFDTAASDGNEGSQHIRKGALT